MQALQKFLLNKNKHCKKFTLFSFVAPAYHSPNIPIKLNAFNFFKIWHIDQFNKADFYGNYSKS